MKEQFRIGSGILVHTMPHITNTGANGAFIEHEVINTSGEPIEVVITFIGHEEGNEDLIIKKVSFYINPWTTGMTSIFDATTLRVYPNPANDVAFVEWPEEIKDLKYITLHNAQGQFVKEFAVNNTITSDRLEIDLKGFSKGLYFINAVTSNKIYTSRLIKS